jgi:hypothetical protein
MDRATPGAMTGQGVAKSPVTIFFDQSPEIE